MGLHDKGDKQKRKQKYTEQFSRTRVNKQRKAEKRAKKLEKAKQRKR